jgi:hypothetical protein
MTRFLPIAIILSAFLAMSTTVEAGPKGSGGGKSSGSKGSGSASGKGTPKGTGTSKGTGTGKGTGTKGTKAYPKGWNNWSYRLFDSRYGCELCYSTEEGCYYYFYPPADCYYPVSYFGQYPPVAAPEGSAAPMLPPMPLPTMETPMQPPVP